MGNAIDIMISSIRAQICGETCNIDKDISQELLSSLYSVSKAHDMAHIVAAELDKQGLLKNDDEISDKFRKMLMIAVFRYERINYELEEICQVLEQAQIPHIPLKGSVMRRYYPEPWMRTSADIDILVHKDQMNKAADALVEELSYRSDGIMEHDIQLFSPGGVHLELHFDTVEDYRAVNSNAVLNRIWDHSYVSNGNNYRREITDDMFYFYHVAHMVKHFENGGCGIRFFLDMWLLNHSFEFDSEKREVLLKEGGLLLFTKVAEHLSEVWFSNAEHDDTTRKMESYIFKGGIYGCRDNSIATHHAQHGGKLGYAIHLIFLPYRVMRIKYPSLDKHKIFLPFYHIHRWFSLIFRGRVKSSVQILKHSSEVADTQTQAVADMLSELGLVDKG